MNNAVRGSESAGNAHNNNERHIYHFTERATFSQALQAGSYRPTAFAKDGFVHCSTAEQLLDAANAIAPRHIELVLLQIDPAKVTSRIVYENLEGGTRLFPHIYGELDPRAVVRVWKFAAVNDRFGFPTDADELGVTFSFPL